MLSSNDLRFGGRLYVRLYMRIVYTACIYAVSGAQRRYRNDPAAVVAVEAQSRQRIVGWVSDAIMHRSAMVRAIGARVAQMLGSNNVAWR